MPMGSTVAGLFHASADKAVRELQAAGFAKDQIEELSDLGGTPEHTAIMFDELVDLGLRRTRTSRKTWAGAAHVARGQPGEGGDIDSERYGAAGLAHKLRTTPS